MRKIIILISFLLFADIVNAVNIENLKTASNLEGLYVQQTEIPTVNILLTFKAGTLYEGPYKDGTANLVAALLAKGTKTKSAKQINEKLESLASSIEIESGRSQFVIGIRTLEENLEETLVVLKDILENANFPEREIEISKESTYQEIKQEKENPSYLANYKARKIFYSKSLRKTYISTLGTKSSVEKITRKDLSNFAKDRLTKANMNISVVGSLSNEEVSNLLNKYLKNMPLGSEIETPEIEVNKYPADVFVERNLPQTVVLLYKEGIRRDSPDYYASILFNYMFGGGGFNSRLMEEIREKRGLTYGVKSAFNYDLKIPSMFKVQLQTTNKNAKLTEKLINQEITKAIKEGFSEEELKNAKSFLVGSFPINIRTSSGLLAYLDMMQRFNMPLDYLDKWTENVQNIELEEVNSFAKKFLVDSVTFSRVFVGGIN